MSSLSINSTAKLSSGTAIPLLGFGVWDSPSHLTTQSCLTALQTGYRHIDTAQVYSNEREVGAALAQSNVPRKEIFITSKILSPAVSNDAEATYAKVLGSVECIVGKEGCLDLMLIHNTSAEKEGVRVMWEAMERAVRDGRVKAIGVSNFGVRDVEGMRGYAGVWPPMVNQIELHPWLQQREIVQYCHENDIVVEAYCPLVRNQKANEPTLKVIAERHGKTTAQVLVRYCLQKNWIPLPKSDNPGRIAQNADIYDFTLSKEDMESLEVVKQEPAFVKAVDD